MAVERAELLRDALTLTLEDRAALVDSLLGSLDREIDIEAEQQWNAEIGRRVSEINSGTVRTIAWQDAQTRLQSRLKP